MMQAFHMNLSLLVPLVLVLDVDFLGLLHLEIITERLEREFDVNLITTTPGVIYKVHKNNREVIDLQNPSNMPDPSQIKKIEEPWIKSTIITPDEYLGSIIKICQDKRGIQTNLSYSGKRAVLSYDLPLNEVVFDFNDRLNLFQVVTLVLIMKFLVIGKEH